MRAALLVAGLVVIVGCRTELRLEQGRRYLCSRDAGENGGQCTQGFRCGLDGYCFDADAGEARACESSLDCASRWRCGLATAGVGVCQQLGVPRPHPCADDSWCEGEWRCGPAGVCLDVSADALEPALARVHPVTRLSPLLSEPLVSVGVASIETGGWHAATLSASSLTLLSAAPREVRAERFAIDGGLALASSSRTLAVVEAPDRTRLVSLSITGTVDQQQLIAFPPFTARGALLAPAADDRTLMVPPLLLTWSDAAFAAWNLSLGQVEVMPSPPGVIAAMHVSVDAPAFLLAATSLGIFEFERAKSVSWRSLSSTNPKACAGNAIDVRALGLRAAEHSVVALYGEPDGGRGCVSLLTFPSDGGIRSVEDVACDDRDRPRSVRTIDDGGTGVWVRCEGPGPEEFSERTFCPGPTCAGPRTFIPQPRERARGRPEALDVVVDELGFQVMLAGDQYERPQFGSLVVPGVAEFDALVSISRGATGLALVGRPLVGDGGLSKFEFTPHLGFARPGGLVDDADLLPLAPVSRSADWRVIANGEIWSSSQSKPLARFSPVRALEGDVVATARIAADGGDFVYVSSFDSLFAGPVGPLGPLLPLRLVPASRSQITSLAAAPEPVTQPDGGVVQHLGYLVNQGRLFRFEARNQVWRSEEIELPEPAVSVWYDGTRARVGTETGRVFGLPTRVPLTQALPAGLTATAFTSLCRQAFVVAQPGVFTLDTPDGGLATWRLDAELNAALPSRRPDVLQQQPGLGLRLVTLDPELVAVNAEGVVASRRVECDAAVR